jgi:allantoin racemase
LAEGVVRHRLLVINPNTTSSVTDKIAAHVREAVGDQVEVMAVTGGFGSGYISCEAAYAVAGHAALECLRQHGQGCDGVLLACFGDPGLFALREVATVPVTALAEAALETAAARGTRLSVVTGGPVWKPMLLRFAASLGLRDTVASVRTIAMDGGQIAASPELALDALAAQCELAATEDGATEVILGGAGLAGLARLLQPRCPVPVIDSVEMGARVAIKRMQAATLVPFW